MDAKTTAADRSVRRIRFPAGDDRKAAEWVLSVGGKVQILSGKQLLVLSDAAARPVLRVTHAILTHIAKLRSLEKCWTLPTAPTSPTPPSPPSREHARR